MRRSCVKALLAALALHCGSAVGVAGQGEIEFGVDSGVRFDLDGTDTEVFTVAFPFASVRLGLHFMRQFSLETGLGYQRRELRDIAGSPSFTEMQTALYGMYHFGSDISRPRVHVLLGLPVQRLRAEEGGVEESDWEIGVLGGLGVTAPITDSWGVRLQGQGIGWKDIGSRISVTLGLSAFLD